MSFTDHKITQFTHRIVDLPDQPNLPADELKARFDSSPEELRQAVNGICDDADRLDDRVSGIIAETFGDAISKSMLSDELADELDAKAVETSVASRFTAEQTAREAADDDLQDQIDAHTSTIAQKVEIYLGSVTGDWKAQTIELPFSPEAVIFIPCGGGKPCLLGQGSVAESENHERIAQLNGNELNFPSWTAPEDYTHMYLALKKG